MHGKSSEIHIFVEKIILFKFLLYPPTYVFIGFFCHLPENLKINLVSFYWFFYWLFFFFFCFDLLSSYLLNTFLLKVINEGNHCDFLQETFCTKLCYFDDYNIIVDPDYGEFKSIAGQWLLILVKTGFLGRCFSLASFASVEQLLLWNNQCWLFLYCVNLLQNIHSLDI